ncbi:MAG: hypothetical protein LBJ64_09875 [Deltaproteobacteria bacterium]|jgi:hypothetical protein|nr:hypothetical protein [Deltaproteobacteria bacterium]
MTRKEMLAYIKKISPEEGFEVLLELLKSWHGLTKSAYFLAKPVCGENDDEEKIAEEVFQRLDMLTYNDAENLIRRKSAGPYSLGPACDLLFKEIISPFFDELRARLKRGQAQEAKTFCLGLIKGLWRYYDESESDYLNAVEDWVGHYARQAQNEWLMSKPTAKAAKEVEKLFQ